MKLSARFKQPLQIAVIKKLYFHFKKNINENSLIKSNPKIVFFLHKFDKKIT